jgi:phosphoribosylformylglycinamidine synthase
MLVETRLLSGALLRNNSLKFICKPVYLRTETANSDFTRALKKSQTIHVPIAHGEGNYFTDDATLKSLEDNDQIAFRYCDENGAVNDSTNPNGSLGNIAGVLNKQRNVMGMMPHPENATQIWQSNTTGSSVFESLFKI